MLADSIRKALAELVYRIWATVALCRCGHPRRWYHIHGRGYCLACPCFKFSRKGFRKVRPA